MLNQRRQRAFFRLLCAAISILAVSTITLGSWGPFGHSRGPANGKEDAINGVVTSRADRHEQGLSETFERGSLSKSSSSSQKKLDPIPVRGDKSHERPTSQGLAANDMNIIGNTNACAETGIDGKRFLDHVHTVLRLLPEESRRTELLRPIVGVGKKSLRELGLRTREFKKYFEAWERLHIFEQNGVSYVRQDLIQQFRCLSITGQLDHLAATIEAYDNMKSLVTEMSAVLFPWAVPYFGDHMTLHTHIANGGRGIVFMAADKLAPQLLAYILTLVPIIRKLGCKLPVEVFYSGKEDLTYLRAELEQLPGVVTRNLDQIVSDKGWELSLWAGKPFALLVSSFREAILVDCDVQFFQNPELMFEKPGYVETGALFFHDRILSVEDRRLRFKDPVQFHDVDSVARMGRRWLEETLPEPISDTAKQSRLWTGQSRQVQEGGLIVVDKWKHFVPLLLVTWLNGPGKGGTAEEGVVGFYDMFYGDKESFWIGFELAGDTNYSFHNEQVGVLGTPSPGPKSIAHTAQSTDGSREVATYSGNVTICAPQLLHLDENGAPFFFNGWILVDKFNIKNQTLVDFDKFIIEPQKISEPEAWVIGDHNLACLTNNQTFDLTSSERALLNEIVQVALDVGSYKPGIAPPPQKGFYD